MLAPRPSVGSQVRNRARCRGGRSAASRRDPRPGGGTCRGRSRGPPAPRPGGTTWRSGISWVTSLRLPPVRVAAERDPGGIGDQMMLAAGSARSTGLRPVLDPPFTPGCGSRRRPPGRSSRAFALRSFARRTACSRGHTPAGRAGHADLVERVGQHGRVHDLATGQDERQRPPLAVGDQVRLGRPCVPGQRRAVLVDTHDRGVDRRDPVDVAALVSHRLDLLEDAPRPRPSTSGRSSCRSCSSSRTAPADHATAPRCETATPPPRPPCVGLPADGP